jgi:hypothetical protein
MLRTPVYGGKTSEVQMASPCLFSTAVPSLVASLAFQSFQQARPWLIRLRAKVASGYASFAQISVLRPLCTPSQVRSLEVLLSRDHSYGVQLCRIYHLVVWDPQRLQLQGESQDFDWFTPGLRRAGKPVVCKIVALPLNTYTFLRITLVVACHALLQASFGEGCYRIPLHPSGTAGDSSCRKHFKTRPDPEPNTDS